MRRILANITSMDTDGTKVREMTYLLDEDGTVRMLFATEDGKRMDEYYRKTGVLDWGSRKMVTPADGKVFILALPTELRDMRLFADLHWDDGSSVPLGTYINDNGWSETYIKGEEEDATGEEE